MKHRKRTCALLLLALSCGGAPEMRDAEPKQLYWGDLHNHNSIGQIRGSLDRTYEIAQSHLDFFAFTPQSQWPDMVEIPQGRNAQFQRGFDAVKANWDRMMELAAQTYEPGKFVPFMGYEVHFNAGDLHIIFPGASAELVYLENHKQWQEYAKTQGAILIPHHPGYKPQWRGTDWGNVDRQVSPVVEMMSEHGNAESDRSAIRYIRHSMGGRYTTSTVHSLWENGVQAGIVASTDDHLGYPGAYGQGLAAVYADSLDRESIMEALRARRTYAVNADRIQLDFKLNGAWMGETLPPTASRRIDITVRGEDVVDRVEILKNNRVLHRDHPVDRQPGDASWDEPVLCRIEYGWGPWAAFDMARIADWEFTLEVKGGTVVSASPHWQSRPFDEDRRDSIAVKGNTVEVVSFTSRQDAIDERPTKDLVLEIQGSPATEIVMTLKQPSELKVTKALGDLAEANDILFTGAFSSESVMVHRVVFSENYKTQFTFEDIGETDDTDWYSVRVGQWNGSMAWSSPIWVEGR